MPRLVCPSDHRIGGIPNLPPPELVEHTEIATAILAFTEATAAQQQARHDARDAEQTLRLQAMQRDADLLADSIEAGEPDPGQPNTERADREIASLRRRAEASEILASRRLTDLQTTIEQHGDEWLRTVEARYAEAAQRWRDTLDQLEQVHRQVRAGRVAEAVR